LPLERLGPSIFELGLPIAVRHEILCTAAQQIWRPAPDSCLPTGADKARWLMDFVVATWKELNHPCSEETVAHALACAERRISAHDDERAVLVHGDVHQWNPLQVQEGFKLVDPNGLGGRGRI
jgi:streptomycin 6-kinase